MTFSFRGRVALVTGGSRGLGLLLAEELARQGARVAICARDALELERAAQQLRRQGLDALAVACDITDPDDVARLCEEVRARLGPVDVLVNNAGVIEVGPFELMTRDDFEEAMATHFWGPLELIHRVLPEMRVRGEGRIANISSIGGRLSVPHLAPYCASKYALVGLSEGLRAELAGEGVRVTTVCPGLMRTGSVEHAVFKGRHAEEYAWFASAAAAPVVSMSAQRAARRIVRAIRTGQADVTPSVPARLAETMHGLFPGLVQRAMALAARVLPGPGGIGTERRTGADSRDDRVPRWLEERNQAAGAVLNQHGAHPVH